MAHLYHRLQVAAHLIKKYADRRLLNGAGITTTQAAVLMIVAEQSDPTQRDVAAQLRISEPAVTGLIDRLTTAGLVERQRSEVDGRAWLLRLTSKGRESLAAARGAFTEVNALLAEAMGEDGIGQLDARLVSLIQQLTDRMDDQ